MVQFLDLTDDAILEVLRHVPSHHLVRFVRMVNTRLNILITNSTLVRHFEFMPCDQAQYIRAVLTDFNHSIRSVALQCEGESNLTSAIEIIREFNVPISRVISDTPVRL
jgi:hypothetical protein